MYATLRTIVRAIPAILILATGSCQNMPPLNPEKESAAIDRSLHQVARDAEQSGDYGSALRYFQQLHEKNPDDVEAVLGYARNMRYTGSPGRGAQLLEGTLENGPEDPRLLSELGRAQLAMGNYDRAIATLIDALDVGGGDWRTYVALGIAQDQLGIHERARRSYDAALTLSPDNAVILTNLGLSRALAGDLDEGITILERAIVTPGTDARARQNLALLYGISGNIEAARKLGRLDLPDEIVDANIAYYRELREPTKDQSGKAEIQDRIGNALRHSRATPTRGDIRQFRIEVGAFNTIDEAIQSWEGLQRQHGGLLGNLSIEFVKSGPATGSRILAWAGPFDAFDRARQVCADLEIRGVGCWVVQR